VDQILCRVGSYDRLAFRLVDERLDGGLGLVTLPPVDLQIDQVHRRLTVAELLHQKLQRPLGLELLARFFVSIDQSLELPPKNRSMGRIVDVWGIGLHGFAKNAGDPLVPLADLRECQAMLDWKQFKKWHD